VESGVKEHPWNLVSSAIRLLSVVAPGGHLWNLASKSARNQNLAKGERSLHRVTGRLPSMSRIGQVILL
jgi:hypothetical protein